MTRRDELAAGLAAVGDRVRAACRAAGRDAADVTVIVVTKAFPASDVRLLAELGVTDIGENRHQEAGPKAEECADLRLRWHFVGQLQSNKAGAVAGYADVVHSVDRVKLVTALSRGAQGSGRDIDCLVQASLDVGGGRGGAAPADVPAVAEAIANSAGLRLKGVMAVAPLDGDTSAAFAALATVSQDLRAAHPDARWISAGMSGDLEVAVAHGATHLRVGGAILGRRPRQV